MRSYVRGLFTFVILVMCVWGFIQGLMWMEKLSQQGVNTTYKMSKYADYEEDSGIDYYEVDTAQTQTTVTKEEEKYPNYNREEVRAITNY